MEENFGFITIAKPVSGIIAKEKTTKCFTISYNAQNREVQATQEHSPNPKTLIRLNGNVSYFV
jgi:hypothetical protein